MTNKGAAQIMAGIVAGLAVWMLYRKAADGLSGMAEELGAIPGRIWSAVEEAGRSVVEGTSAISDPDGGGFVTTAPDAGRIVDYSRNRDIDPLIAYFVKWGNTAAARAQAYKAGWTSDEVSLAVLAMAQANGNV